MACALKGGFVRRPIESECNMAFRNGFVSTGTGRDTTVSMRKGPFQLRLGVRYRTS